MPKVRQLQLMGTVYDLEVESIANKNPESTVENKYDWIGTQEQYIEQRANGQIPDDWVCFITDDNVGPSINNPTITLTQNGTTKGSFTLNQSTDQTIDLDAVTLAGLDNKVDKGHEVVEYVPFTTDKGYGYKKYADDTVDIIGIIDIASGTSVAQNAGLTLTTPAIPLALNIDTLVVNYSMLLSGAYWSWMAATIGSPVVDINKLRLRFQLWNNCPVANSSWTPGSGNYLSWRAAGVIG